MIRGWASPIIPIHSFIHSCLPTYLPFGKSVKGDSISCIISSIVEEEEEEDNNEENTFSPPYIIRGIG